MDAATTSSVRLETLIRDKISLRTLQHLGLQLRRGTVAEPENVANATAKALRTVVSAAKFTSIDELITIIRTAGSFLQDAQPKEQTIGNITRRVLHLLREEARAASMDVQSPQPQQPPSRHAAHPSSSSSATSTAATTTAATTTTTANSSAAHSRVPSSSFQAAAHMLLSGDKRTTSSSSIGGGSPSRPTLSAFRPGSTFSISDLVAAGAGHSSSANASSFAASPVDSGAATPAWGSASLDRLGYGVEKLQIHKEEQQSDDDDDDDEEEGDAGSEEEGGSATPEEVAHTAKGSSGKKRKSVAGLNAGVYQLKPLLIQAIQELIDELETVNINIAKDARDHVHSGEVILTLGYSHTVEVFLKAAAKDRRFTVIVAETAPEYSGHKLAKALSAANISTLLVPDSSAFTLMPRISKILLGAHCILANGGLLAAAGARMVAEAARAHSTPTVVLAGVYKVCPDWRWVGIGTSLVDRSGTTHSSIAATTTTPLGNAAKQGSGFTSQGSPLDVLGLTGAEEVEVVNAIWDYVDPDMIDLLITNVGEHPVSLVYRLLSENYDAQDLVL